MSEEWQNKSFEKTMDFSLEAQKSLLLINGGSAVAILAIVSQHGQKYNLAIPLLVYGIGVIFSVLCLFLTRLAQDYFTDQKEKSGNFVNSLIHFFIVLTLCCFGYASARSVEIFFNVQYFYVPLSALGIIIPIFIGGLYYVINIIAKFKIK